MDKFLEVYYTPKLNHEEIEKLNRLTTSKENKSLTKNLPTQKRPGPDGLTGKFQQTFKEELTPILLKFFKKKFKRREYFLTYSLRPALPRFQSQIKTPQEKKTTDQDL